MIDYLLQNTKISYEVSAIFFDLVIVIFVSMASDEESAGGVGGNTLRSFRLMAYSALAVTVSEVLAPLNMRLPYSPGYNILRDFIETTQFLFEHYLLFAFALYITSLTNFKPPKWLKVMNGAVFVYAVTVCLLNPFLHLIFSFDRDKWEYVSGPMYLAGGYFPAFYFGGYTLIVFIIKFKYMLKRERLAIFFTIMMVFTESVMQPMFHGRLKLVALFSSLGVFILYLSLETTDYQRLLATQGKLLEAREEAASANRAKSVFIASMSHEIRTPMNAILGINELILQNSREEKILGYSRDMKNAGSSLLNIINDVLDVSKMEAGQFEIMEEQYYLDELVDAMAKKLEAGVAPKNIEYQIRVQDDLPGELYGDSVRLSQVLSNITDNAIKYTKRGIVIFEVSGYCEGEYVRLDFSVTDTGIGIKKEDMGDLFKSFKRIDMENNRSIEGTGLGLSIAKQIISLMGGTIEVESTYGQGSIFTVHISQRIVGNMTVSQHKSVENKSSIPIKDASGKRILLVDDNEMNLRVARAFLERCHADITSISDSSEALMELSQNPYDLVFLDDLMPGLNGPAVMLRTRRMADNPNSATPMVIMSGSSVESNYGRMGFDGRIEKPLKEDAVAEIINKLL